MTLSSNAASSNALNTSPTFQVNTGVTLDLATGIRVNSLTKTGSGTITVAIGGYFLAPTIGTNNISLYTDNLNCGYSFVTPPIGGALFLVE